MDELRECPFCGGDAEFERKGNSMRSTIVSCQWCGCSQESNETFNCGHTWNTRVSNKAEEERDVLAEAIRSAAVTLGICKDNVALTGPDLLVLCGNIEEAHRASDKVIRGLVESMSQLMDILADFDGNNEDTMNILIAEKALAQAWEYLGE